MLRRHLKLVSKRKKLQRRMVWMKKEMTVAVIKKLAIEDNSKHVKRKIEDIAYVIDIFKEQNPPESLNNLYHSKNIIC
jgi:sulfate adenylyltransferase subunit 1 (EFTu-like GTPase family)